MPRNAIGGPLPGQSNPNLPDWAWWLIIGGAVLLVTIASIIGHFNKKKAIETTPTTQVVNAKVVAISNSVSNGQSIPTGAAIAQLQAASPGETVTATTVGNMIFDSKDASGKVTNVVYTTPGPQDGTLNVRNVRVTDTSTLADPKRYVQVFNTGDPSNPDSANAMNDANYLLGRRQVRECSKSTRPFNNGRREQPPPIKTTSIPPLIFFLDMQPYGCIY